MEIGIIYFLIIVISNTIGAVSGIGGGIIIRPIFDAIGYHNVISISFFSSVAVLVMAIVSSTKKIRDGITINKELVTLTAIGSIFGGIIGNLFLESLLVRASNEDTILAIQISIAITTLSISLLYTIMKWQSLEMADKAMYLLVGCATGCIASILGLGGGPLNVVAFMFFFGLSIKDAAIYSLLNIFFSQMARVITIGLTTGYQIFDLNILMFIIPAAIIGGLVGARLSNVFSEKKVTVIYQLMLFGVIGLNVVNLIRLI